MKLDVLINLEWIMVILISCCSYSKLALFHLQKHALIGVKQGDPFSADLSVTFDCYKGQVRSTNQGTP